MQEYSPNRKYLGLGAIHIGDKNGTIDSIPN